MGISGKKYLIEKMEASRLDYLKGADEHFLGFLYGVAADATVKTRNGRRYTIELWQRVKESPDFIEAMETRTCFGECDHPLDDRVETLLKQVAMTLLEFEIKEDKVYCKFGILDTPNGNILKVLLDAGCQIGVSSRGVGDEIQRNGETIIDPDTYTFFGFDAVVTPAVINARPGVLTSDVKANENVKTISKKSLTESFNREIAKATTKTELDSILRIAQSANIAGLDSITESINIKLNSLEAGDNISARFESDLYELAKEVESLKQSNAKLESKVKAKDIRLKEYQKALHRVTESAGKVSKLFRHSKMEVNALQETVHDSSMELEALSKSKNTVMSKNSSLIRENYGLKEQQKSSAAMCDEYKKKIESLENEVRIRDSKIRSLLESKVEAGKEAKLNEAKKTQLLEGVNTKLTESERKLSNTQNRLKSTLNSYLRLKCMTENVSVESILKSLPQAYSVADIDAATEKLSAISRRIGQMPIVMERRDATIAAVHNTLTKEDRELESLRQFSESFYKKDKE